MWSQSLGCNVSLRAAYVNSDEQTQDSIIHSNNFHKPLVYVQDSTSLCKNHWFCSLSTAFVCLCQVFFLQFPTALLCGEIRKAYVEVCNVSGVALCGLRVISTHPDFFTFGSKSAPLSTIHPTSAENNSAYQTFATPLQPDLVASEMLVSAEDFSQPSDVIDIPIEGNTLQPGESTQLPLWLRGPDQEGVHEINFLFYYENIDKGNKIR